MRVLHINHSDSGGGASIAAYRHHEAMRKIGIDSKMLVIKKTSDDRDVIQHNSSKIVTLARKIYHRIFNAKFNFYGTWTYNGLGYDLFNEKCVQEADVIYLHWINFYTLSISSLESILKLGKPVYWFLHDMWPLTGGCHYSLECIKYQDICLKCPLMYKRKGSRKEHDLSNIQFIEKKKKLTKYPNLHFLTPSRWLMERVKESALFKNHSVEISRNVIDTDKFFIRDRVESRRRLGLPLEKKLILFGSDNISSPYKGWSILKNALSEPLENVECVMYGSCDWNVQSEVAVKVHSLGKISDMDILIDIYNACNLFVTPSLADNYPNVIVEAMACGIPVVASNIGGIPDLVKNGKNGLLVEILDGYHFRNAIEDIIFEKIVFDPYVIRNDIVNNNSYATVMINHRHLF